MRRSAARFCAILLCVAAVSATPAAPATAAPGFAVEFTQLPDEFTAGADPRAVTVVVSTQNGPGCAKVRWSLVLQVDGVSLDQVRVGRFEEDGAFPMAVRADDDSARFTDVRLDPGTLCRDRTVTARYAVSVDEDAPDGTVTLLAEAYDVRERLLERATVTRDVTGGRNAAPSPEPSAEPTETPDEAAPTEPVESAGDDAATGAGAGTAQPIDATAAAGAGADSGLGRVGLIIGAVLIFLGVSLLLRLRRRANAAGPAEAPADGATGAPHWSGRHGF